VRELRPGLWHWTEAHPDRSASKPWEQAVSFHARDRGTATRPDPAEEPVQLTTHGTPANRAALGRALSVEPAPER